MASDNIADKSELGCNVGLFNVRKMIEIEVRFVPLNDSIERQTLSPGRNAAFDGRWLGIATEPAIVNDSGDH